MHTDTVFAAVVNRLITIGTIEFGEKLSMKVKGSNFLKPKIGKVHPRNLIKTWTIFKGDTVQVVSGMRDVGKTGKVLEVIKDKNAIVVENVALVL